MAFGSVVYVKAERSESSRPLADSLLVLPRQKNDPLRSGGSCHQFTLWFLCDAPDRLPKYVKSNSVVEEMPPVSHWRNASCQCRNLVRVQLLQVSILLMSMTLH